MVSFKSCSEIWCFKRRTAVLSAMHFAVDMYCAVLFFGFISGGASAWQAMVLYNACAFAGQAPIGARADKLKNGLAVAAAGCFLLAVDHPIFGKLCGGGVIFPSPAPGTLNCGALATGGGSVRRGCGSRLEQNGNQIHLIKD